MLTLVAVGADRRAARTAECSLHALKQLILEKTEGTPFFMEEVVQDLFEAGSVGPDERRGGCRDCPRTAHLTAPLHIPTTVQGVLAARIDRLRARRESPVAAARRHWPRVSLEPRATRRHPARRRTVSPPCLAAAQRVSLRTAGVSRSGVHLQARADPGSGLRHGAAGATQSACTSARRRRSKRYTANAWKSTTASWRITTVAVATPRRRWSISSWPGNRRCSGRRMRKRSATSPLP